MPSIKLGLIGSALPTRVVLSDPTNTFGVIRKDTQEVIVQAGTPMVDLGGGRFSYDFPPPDSGLGYEYWATGHIGGTTIRVHRSITGSQVFVPAIDSVECPALVIATVLRELKMATDPVTYKVGDPNSFWPVSIGGLNNSPIEMLTTYDSGAMEDGIIVTKDGPVSIEHGDVQIRIRAADYLTARHKLTQIKDTLVKVKNYTLSVPSIKGEVPALHYIAGITVLSGVAFIGLDDKGNRHFTVNFRTTIHKVKS